HEMDDVAGDLAAHPEPERDEYLRRSAKALATRITVIAPDGRVLTDTDLPPSEVSQMENHGSRPEVVDARKTGEGFSRRYSATESEDRFYFARRIADGSVLRFSVPAEGVRELESGYLWSAR